MLSKNLEDIDHFGDLGLEGKVIWCANGCGICLDLARFQVLLAVLMYGCGVKYPKI